MLFAVICFLVYRIKESQTLGLSYIGNQDITQIFTFGYYCASPRMYSIRLYITSQACNAGSASLIGLKDKPYHTLLDLSYCVPALKAAQMVMVLL